MAIIVDKDGNVVTVENEPEEARAMFPNNRDFGVGDVLIDGKSIVNAAGDAEIPTGGSNVKGVFSVSGDGLGVTTGRLRVNSPQSARIKEGTQLYQPIDIYHNHEGVFYGMAKAAGDTTQAESTNPVGTYTDDAKIAIQKMLGIYEAAWELIRDESFTNETEADYTIEADSNASPFELTDVYLEVWYEATTQQAVVGSSGVVHFYYDTTNYLTLYLGGSTVDVGSPAKGACAMITRSKGAVIRENTQYKTLGTGHNPLGSPATVSTNRSLLVALSPVFNKIVIKSVTGKMSYRLYGKRKWQ